MNIRILTEMRNLMRTQPVMQFQDCNHHWVCPFCRQPVEYVDMALEQRQVAPERAVLHLMTECPVARHNPRVTITASEMQEVVDGINAAKKASRSQPGPTTQLMDIVAGARAVQLGMLPSNMPTVPGYEFGRVFQGCEDVSGDFYTWVELTGGRIGIMIADVSGHGMEAALVMTMARKVFEIRMNENNSATAVMKKVNRDVFPDLKRETFITAAFSILDPPNNQITFTRAGHNPAILWQAASRQIAFVNPTGMMLGTDRGPHFDRIIKQQTVDLQPGDLFLKYTDGVTEAMDPDGEEFGTERLIESVQRVGGNTANDVLGEIMNTLEHFRGPRPQNDDITLVALRRTS